MQTKVNHATVAEMRECNRILEHAKQTSDVGIYFSPDGPKWDEAVMVTITDASFCNEAPLDAQGNPEEHRSQQAYLNALGPANTVNAEQIVVHPISWGSTVIKRVCRATLMAETFAMINGTERGTRLRAAVVDCKGQLDMKNWEASAAEGMAHVWITDCDSLYEHLVSTKHKQVENKRLAIDLLALRQQIWERDDNEERTGEVDHSKGDYPRWVDTSAMTVDPLTKVMGAEKLEESMMTGIIDFRATAESLMVKARNRESRKSKKKNIENDETS